MNLKSLLALLADGAFHSGEDLGNTLGISRAAVWKQIERLRELGVDIHSVTGKGYRMPASLSLLDKDIILAHLGDLAPTLSDQIDVLFSIDSTNLEAMRQIQQGVGSRIIVAEHQGSGRGRRGRAWVSPLGASIYLSVVVSFHSGIAALEGLSLAVAVMVRRAVVRCGCQGAGLKWPNDLHVDGRKIAGILLEINGDLTGPCRVIIGIGLNVNIPESAARTIDQPFSDLASHSHRQLDRNQVLAILIQEIHAGLTRFEEGGFAAFHAEWDVADVYKGRSVELTSGSNKVKGVVRGVSDTGALLLETDSGVRAMAGGELSCGLRETSG